MPFDVAALERTSLRWAGAARIQPWRHPEARIWEELAGEEDVPGIIALLELTEPDTFRSLGRTDRLSGLEPMRGDAAGWVMPAFTFGGPGRFNDATFGCFYAARELETAVAETVHHQEQALRATREPPLELRMRVLRADLEARSVVRLGTRPAPPELYHPDDHAVSRELGAAVRAAGLPGIAYASVRRGGGRCVALYHPGAIRRCEPGEALAYLWDGARIHAVERRAPLNWSSPA